MIFDSELYNTSGEYVDNYNAELSKHVDLLTSFFTSRDLFLSMHDRLKKI